MQLFGSAVYLLCFLTSTACAYLLGRSFLRSHASILMWSAICFGFLALNNLLLVVDLLVVESIDLRLPRLVVALIAVTTLLIGFIWNDREV